MKNIKKLLRYSQNNMHIVLGVLVVIAISIVGVHLLVATHATSDNVVVTADSGSLSGGATVQTNSQASNGEYVQFGSSTGSSCTDPVYKSSNPEATWTASNGDLVNNNFYNVTTGAQTLYVCNYNSWYVTTNQPNDPNESGAIYSYPDTEDDLVPAPYSCKMPNCGPVVSTISSLTSDYGISVPDGTNIGYDAAYDTYVNWGTHDYCSEIMVWNKWENDLNGYTFTYKNVSIGGLTFNILWESSPPASGSNCGLVIFALSTQVPSGTVDLLSIYNWIIANHPDWFNCASTAACQAGGATPAELSVVEYGVEIEYTNGTQQFGLTNFSVSMSK